MLPSTQPFFLHNLLSHPSFLSLYLPKLFRVCGKQHSVLVFILPTVEENSQFRNMLIQHTCSMASAIQSSENLTQTNARNVNNSALESMKCSIELRDNFFCILFTISFLKKNFFTVLATGKHTFFSHFLCDMIYG